jgi:protein-L-isoaspartate(D-aspartate) O-methyltransferase
MDDFAARRARMVERQLRARGIDDERVLAAMGRAPREAFVPGRETRRAYADSALPIGSEQTISQPWIVAAICQALALAGEERVLEIGTGSGYSTYVLALLAAEVVSIERHEGLSRTAGQVLDSLGSANVELLVGDGSLGLPGLPVSGEESDTLVLLRRRGDEVESHSLGPCRFVPLIGEEGF